MIVKVQNFKDGWIGPYEEQMYFNVEKVYRIKDKTENEFLQLKIKEQEQLGKTIEKLA